jgi:phenol/toluene 2-monooxygenase (NADH) P5/A5
MRGVRRRLVRWQPGGSTFEVHAGQRLLDAIDALEGRPEIWLPTACRSANCGTCRVRVVDGESGVIPADPWEQAVLMQHGAGPGERLGCQLCLIDDTDAAAPGASLVITLERLP